MDASRTASPGHEKRHSNSWRLSTPKQTRHFWSNRLILFVKLMSGFQKQPDIYPTSRPRNPTFGCWERVNVPAYSQSSQHSKLRAPPALDGGAKLDQRDPPSSSVDE
jgi:hypothetical protein